VITTGGQGRDSTVEVDLDRLLGAAADLALVLDRSGRIREVHGSEAVIPKTAGWVGRLWVDTVTPETRTKVERLLEDARSPGIGKTRQVNQSLSDGSELPVDFTAVPFEAKSDTILALGRNLQAVARLQQQLVLAQEAMEREYWRVRFLETRYRILFHRASEAVLFLDVNTGKVTDANEAAARRLGIELSRLLEAPFPLGLDGEAARRSVNALAEAARSEEEMEILGPGGEKIMVRPVLLRQGADQQLLLHLQGSLSRLVDNEDFDTLDALDHIPDGFVLADGEGRVLRCNQAFVAMVQASSESVVKGESLGRWLTRPGADLAVLLNALQTRSALRQFPTVLVGEDEADVEVEISAAVAPEADPPVLGMVLRDVSFRMSPATTGADNLNEALSSLTHQLGRVPLKKLVRDTVSVVEQHFIDAALELTGGNRTAAADLLKLSRQSLYTKLNRYDV
jgi:transcriptional regulator PpsR